MFLLIEVFADQSYTYLQTGSPVVSIVALMKSCDLGLSTYSAMHEELYFER